MGEIKDKIDEYIRSILDKKEITPTEYAVLCAEYQRRTQENKKI